MRFILFNFSAIKLYIFYPFLYMVLIFYFFHLNHLFKANIDKIPTRKPTSEVAIDLTPEVATELTKHKKSKLILQQELMS